MKLDKTSDSVVDSCAVCLYFDAATENLIRQAWAALADAGLSSTMPDVGWRPHITLSGCRELHLKNYLPALQKLASQTQPLQIVLAHTGFFPVSEDGMTTLILSPIVTRPLLELHERHHKLVETFCGSVSSYYMPDRWVPHCTLALNFPDRELTQVALLTRLLGLPITCLVQAVGVVRVARPHVEEVACLSVG